MTALSDAVGDDEIRERLPLRTGGTVVVTDDRLLVSADDEITSIALDDVAEVTIEAFDWFLAVLSVLLVGYGLYSIPRSVLLGGAFAVFGAGSLYWTYRKRGKARIKVADRPKPISVFPADTAAFADALESLRVEADGADEAGGTNEAGRADE
ncbi:hypothetical protein [Halorussus lipolyticus]|uniref:hypothetical protein n=1 Tax=Halorussus lipolyticus TaxID=3034024 RepID=UPI0023E786A9|nr:hypothetical protein [Halorussus sp. DT80]